MMDRAGETRGIFYVLLYTVWYVLGIRRVRVLFVVLFPVSGRNTNTGLACKYSCATDQVLRAQQSNKHTARLLRPEFIFFLLRSIS